MSPQTKVVKIVKTVEVVKIVKIDFLTSDFRSLTSVLCPLLAACCSLTTVLYPLLDSLPTHFPGASRSRICSTASRAASATSRSAS